MSRLRDGLLFGVRAFRFWKGTRARIAPMLEYLPLGVFAALLATAAISDVATLTIPNWVSIALAAIFPIAAFATGMSPPSIGLHLLFGAGVLVIAFFLFQANVFGGGDAKLLAAAGVWVGYSGFFAFAFWTAMIGGVLAALLLGARTFVPPNPFLPDFLNRLLQPKGGIPYGVAIASGAVLAFHAATISHAAALTTP